MVGESDKGEKTDNNNNNNNKAVVPCKKKSRAAKARGRKQANKLAKMLEGKMIIDPSSAVKAVSYLVVKGRGDLTATKYVLSKSQRKERWKEENKKRLASRPLQFQPNVYQPVRFQSFTFLQYVKTVEIDSPVSVQPTPTVPAEDLLPLALRRVMRRPKPLVHADGATVKSYASLTVSREHDQNNVIRGEMMMMMTTTEDGLPPKSKLHYFKQKAERRPHLETTTGDLLPPKTKLHYLKEKSTRKRKCKVYYFKRKTAQKRAQLQEDELRLLHFRRHRLAADFRRQQLPPCTYGEPAMKSHLLPALRALPKSIAP